MYSSPSRPFPAISLTSWILIMMTLYEGSIQASVVSRMTPTGVAEDPSVVLSLPVSRLRESWAIGTNSLPDTSGGLSISTLASPTRYTMSVMNPLQESESRKTPQNLRRIATSQRDPEMRAIVAVAPTCGNLPPVSGNMTLDKRAVCPWEILTNTDPLRVPRDIHYVRCLCSNPQIFINSTEQPLCRENRVPIPYVLCDQDPMRGGAKSCQLFVDNFAVSCVAAYLTDM